MNSVHVMAFVATLLFSLVMGVLWGTWISLARSMRHFPADMVITIGKAMIGNLASPMRILMLATLIGIVIFDAQLLSGWHTPALGLGLVALACIVGVLAVTLSVSVPIDMQIRVWSPQALPSDWQITVRRWQRYHAARTALSLVGFSALLGACVLLR